MICRALLVAVLILGANRAMAQQQSVGPGARVRITTHSALSLSDLAELAGALPGSDVIPAGRSTVSIRTREGVDRVLPIPGIRFSGVLVAADNQVLTIRPDGASPPMTVPLRAIAQIEEALGHRSRARYAGFGALMGFGVGGLIGLMSGLNCAPNDWFCSPAFNAVALGTLGAGVGVVAGTIIPPAERWFIVDIAAVTNVPEISPFASVSVRPPPRVTLAFQVGQPSSGPARDVEQDMRTSGYADASPGFFSDPVAHPISNTAFNTDDMPMMFEFDYWIQPSWSVGLVIARTPMGETLGFNRSANRRLTVQYAATSVGAVVTKTYRAFKVGAGPAIHTTRAKVTDHSFDVPWSGDSRLGFIALEGVRTPTQTRMYLDLSFQYRYVGSGPFGPLTSSASGGRPETVPASRAQFSHWLIGFGPGIRF